MNDSFQAICCHLKSFTSKLATGYGVDSRDLLEFLFCGEISI